jgi:hypothetical protein
MAPTTQTSLVGEHSTEDWEKQRARFTHLYIDEDKTLRQSMESMSALYDFKATQVNFVHQVKGVD